MFKLVIQDDEGKTTVVPLIRDEITIGRKEGNTIRLTERNVSRRHARIVRSNNEVQIEDLGSYNGIRVNNARIAERVSLRISDQVQIGDYKLYLKAEGVEQVDDARTMPIERVDAPTDIVAAIPANGAATLPQATSPTAPVAAQLVGNAARTQVAIADTDPAGRPVANAAAVAALSHSVGYGKLVVLSSNFAKREFELSRPQMIIGRTDENDIVINHRSISRNHAKLVREPDTQRYTISDLQSSNGVRVNGQDYGKVELRRGDVVDLGHVRLRFVEPGEDFVFDRDAVITDVPDGGKKGMMIALILGAVVLIGVILFFVLKNGDKATNHGAGNGTGSATMEVIADASQIAVVAIDADVTTNNGSGTGSQEPTVTPDSAIAGPPNEQLTKCVELQSARNWTDLQTCANGLATSNPAKAKELGQKAKDEVASESFANKVTEAVHDESLKKAADALYKIKKDSVYLKDAQKSYDDLEKKLSDDMMKKGHAAADSKHCKDLAVLVDQAQSAGIAAQLRKIPCEKEVAVIRPNGNGSGSSTVVTPPPPACDPQKAADMKAKAVSDMNVGADAAALVEFEQSYHCRPDSSMFPVMVLTACRSSNAAKAKQYFAKCGSACNSVEARCIQLKITLRP